MLGLIATLNTAKKGMSAQQACVNVTSHNIANANTEGYSRQRANLVTSRPFCTPSMTNAAEPGQMGTGVDVASIDRIRNGFLDYQIRFETSSKGKYDVRQQFLTNIEAILNEPTDSGISNAMSEFYSAWQSLSTHPESSETRTSVVQKSLSLTDMLNHSFNQLEKLKTDVHDTTKESVFQLNSYLDQLDSINQEIMQISISHQSPNDLEDRRDLLLDKLSTIININVDKNQPYNGQNILPVDVTGIDTPTLVRSVQKDIDIKRFSYVSGIEETAVGSGVYNITYYKNGDTAKDSNRVTISNVALDANQYKQLDECRVLWADKDGNAIDFTNQSATIGATATFAQLALYSPTSGEICGQISTQNDINAYETSLNSLSKTIALSVNAVHDGTDVSKTPFFVMGTDTDDTNEEYITAGNISVNPDFQENVMNIKVSTNGDVTKDGSGDGKRALAIAQLKDTLLNFADGVANVLRTTFINDNGGSLSANAEGVNTFVNQTGGMKVDAYFNDIISKLGVQCQEAVKIVDNKDSLLTSFKTQRDSVSGVSIDEEMANLIQFQHAYTANAKIISTVDELLDVVVNSLKR